MLQFCVALLQEHYRLWERKDKVEDRNLVGMMKMLECKERSEASQPEVGCVSPAACDLPVQQQCPAFSELTLGNLCSCSAKTCSVSLCQACGASSIRETLPHAPPMASKSSGIAADTCLQQGLQAMLTADHCLTDTL